MTISKQNSEVLIRGILLFIVLIGIVGIFMVLKSWQGKEIVGDVGPFTLYYADDVSCINYVYENYLVVCENQYVLRSGFATYTVKDALNKELININDLKDLMEIMDNN